MTTCGGSGGRKNGRPPASPFFLRGPYRCLPIVILPSKTGRAVFASLLGALLLVAPAVKSQGRSDPSGVATARQLFAEAAELEAHSQWAPAAAKLKSALSIKETPGLRYHLAHCEEQLGAFVEASSDYDRAADLIRDGAAAPDVEPLLPLAQRRLESRVAKLDLVVPPGTAATAELDDRALPASAVGTSIKLDPGVHRVVVRALGRAEYRADIALSVGEHRTLKVFFPNPVMRSPVTTPEPETGRMTTSTAREQSAPPARQAPYTGDRAESSGVRTAVLVGEAAVTVAGAALGIGFALARPAATRRVHAAQAKLPDDVHACSSGPTAACTELGDAIQSHERDVGWETAGLVTAGLGAGVFAATWALWPVHRPPPLSVQPATGGAMLSARGVF